METLTGGAILIEAKGIERSFTVRYDSALNAVLINPGRMLPGTIYTVTVTEEITDLAGNPLAPESWSFSTEEVAAGSAPVDIVINGVEEGGAYDEPVTITISVSSGGYSASLSYNGEPAEPVVSGLTVSRRGAYDLTVTADSGLSRSMYFTMGTETEAYELNIANEVTAPDRSSIVTASEYVGAGLRYFVDGQRYFYLSATTVYLFDMRTGENRLLFDAGQYYEGTGGYNAEPSTACSLLGISGDLVLYCKSTGADCREPLGESLHAFNRVTGEEVTVIPRDSENPLRIAHAGCVRGLAACIAYRMHGEVDGDVRSYGHEGTFEYDLVSAHLDGGDPQVLYSVSSGSITAVSWSPEGAHIAFVWFRDYASPVMLGILTVATGEVVLREDLTNPLWSPDGSRLYAQGKIEENGYRQSLIALFSDLRVDRVICELQEIAPAALSPAGQFMALFMSDGIHVADLPSGVLARRLVASAANMGPTRLFWSGDETKLVFNAVNVAGDWSTGAHVLDLAEGNIR